VISASPRLFTPTPAGKLFKPGPQAGADGEETAEGENCGGVPAVGAGRYIYNGKAAVVRRSARVEIGTQYNARDAG